MASTDALPVPRKNAAYRVTFGIFKNDGTLITGATGLDSEVSKDAGTFADCTNEATEIATSSGIYYLDLTSTEMNADTVAILVKSSSTGAVPVVLSLYPQEAGDIQVNTTYWSGTAVASPDTAGYPKVTIKSGTGTGEVSLSSGRVAVQAGIRKNQALANFPFLMTDSTNHNPLTGLTVTATRSIDGAAFGSGTIANMTEVANGIYQCDLGAGDLNGDTIVLRFTGSGADDLFVTLVTEP
jgi:hypothetical protein